MEEKKMLQPGEPAPEARVYKCSGCGVYTALIEGEIAPHCEHCSAAKKAQFWTPTSRRLITVSKNIAKEFEKRKRWHEKLSDVITSFFGSMKFVVFHLLFFAFWIVANTEKIPGVPVFDPYPFGLLTTIVSLEAIMLSTFILVSQKRSGDRAELRSEYDYQVDMKSEKNIAEILELLREHSKDKKKK
jgi:uncharacterized membrane protein